MRIFFSLIMMIFSSQWALAYSCIPVETQPKAITSAIFEMKDNKAILIAQKGKASFAQNTEYTLKIEFCPTGKTIKTLKISGPYLVISSPRPQAMDDAIILSSQDCCGFDIWRFYESLEEAQKAYHTDTTSIDYNTKFWED